MGRSYKKSVRLETAPTGLGKPGLRANETDT
jgi:hypothetical protein